MSSSYLDKLEAQFDKLYGKGLLTSGQDLVDKPKVIIPVSPMLNLHLAGGIPEGSMVIFSGPPKGGKTVTALAVARNAQCPEYGSRPVFYLDAEHRLKKMNLEGTAGLLLDKPLFNHIHSTSDKILTAEDWLTLAENIIKTVPRCIVILDSTSSLCSDKELTGDITATARNDAPKLFASFCRKNSAAISVNNVIVIGIQHLIANTGFGSQFNPFHEDGGNKLKHAQDIKMRIKFFKDWKVGEKIVGQEICWDIMNSALGALPSLVTSYLRYGIGIDNLKEWIELGLSFGIIDKGEKSSWYTFGDTKVQGEDKMYQFLASDIEACKELIKRVKEVSGQ